MLKRTGSKRIIVNGHRFRYVISETAASRDRDVALAITVQQDTQGGGRLRITGLTARRVPEEQSKCYCGRTLERPIEPRHVERLIRLALTRGWQPASPGGPFVMHVEDGRGALR